MLDFHKLKSWKWIGYFIKRAGVCLREVPYGISVYYFILYASSFVKCIFTHSEDKTIAAYSEIKKYIGRLQHDAVF